MLVRRLAALVSTASDGQVGPDDLTADGSLALAGVGSLALLRLIDAIETEYGVVVDLDGDVAFLDTLDGIARHLTAQGVTPV